MSEVFAAYLILGSAILLVSAVVLAWVFTAVKYYLHQRRNK